MILKNVIKQGALLFLLTFSAVVFANEYSIIQTQFVDYYTASSDEAAAQQLWSTMRADGTWQNIDYASKQRGGWPTLNHLKNLVTMSTVYADSKSQYYRNAELKKSIVLGLNHWLENKYTNPNWWQPKIGIPENVCISLILLGEDLPQDLLLRSQNGPLKRTKMGMTGQNKVWLAGIAFMKGHLSNNRELMKAASDTIWSELKVSTQEGIQPDWSFHQHGPQQQFGNYGLSFGNRMVMWGSILRNTPYALSGDKLEILRNYQLNGPTWISWNGMMDLAGCGRQVFEDCQEKRWNGLNKQLQKLQSIDPAFKKQYAKALSTDKNRTGHQSFWRSEMAVQRQKNWYASLKMSSTRVVGCETCNSENMQGLHLGDGMLLTYTSGKEYQNIVPLWDWKRLPGTTCDQGMMKLEPKGWKSSYGGSNYSGVLGNNEVGVAAMIYKRENLSAHKSWFFTPKGIVCLGAGIKGSSNGPVFTSIEQSRLNGGVFASQGELENGKHELKKGTWVHHNKVGYQLLQTSYCGISHVKGNWSTSFPVLGDHPSEGDVFSIWVNHGQNPQGEGYAYIVHPGVLKNKMDQIANNTRVHILSNTPVVQAIENKNDVQAVFYQAGNIKTSNDMVMEVNVPCLMMLNKHAIFVSDPLHQSKVVEVKVKGKTYRINLPQGDNTGKGVSMNY